MLNSGRASTSIHFTWLYKYDTWHSMPLPGIECSFLWPEFQFKFYRLTETLVSGDIIDAKDMPV